MRYRIMLLAGLACVAGSALANHLAEGAHLRLWQRADRVFYTMGPPGNPRELRPAPEERRPPALLADARDLLDRSPMYALMLLERGQIVFEAYARTADRDHRLLSLSMAKSLTALAVGEALCSGKIRSLDDKVEAYAPALADTAFGRASIRSVLKMSSGSDDRLDPVDGVDWKDFQQVFTGKLSVLEYLRKHGAQATRFGSPIKDGEVFRYNGLNTEALAFVVEGATGAPFHKWFEASVWKRARAEGQGHWQLDKAGKPIVEALFMATTRDYARIALSMLENLGGRSGDACRSKFLQEATSPLMSTSGVLMPGYGYQVWIDRNGNPWFLGHGGQMIGFHVKSEKILVTMGFRFSMEGVLDLFNAWTSDR